MVLGAAAWRGRYLHRFTGTLLRTLGHRAAERFATWIADGIFDLQPAVRKIVERNLCRAGVARDESSAQALARGMFIHSARFWTEVLFVPRVFRPAQVLGQVEWHEGQRWEDLAHSARPRIFVSPYAGNPVVGALALSRRFAPLTVAVDQASRAVIDTVWPGVLRSARLRFDPGLRIVTLPHESARLGPALAEGGSVCLLPGPTHTGGMAGTFLGQPVRFRTTALRLARRHGARIAVWSCLRPTQPPGPFQLQLHGEVELGRRPLRGGLRDLIALLEAALLYRPEQYLWTRI